MSMTTVDRTEALNILTEAAETLESVRESDMLQTGWEKFEDYVDRMQAALERDDLAEVRALRRSIEELDHRQAAVAALDIERKVKQSERLRTASDNLSQRLKALKAAMSVQNAERPP
jgi:hypothetical protein